MEAISTILESNKLSQTSTRKAILEILINSSRAMTEKEIKENLACDCDRTTVYRSLRTFQEKGIVHQIIIDNIPRFALVSGYEKLPKHHAHFKCESCGEITCLFKVSLTVKELPRGFRTKNHNIVISGICGECNKASQPC